MHLGSPSLVVLLDSVRTVTLSSRSLDTRGKGRKKPVTICLSDEERQTITGLLSCGVQNRVPAINGPRMARGLSPQFNWTLASGFEPLGLERDQVISHSILHTHNNMNRRNCQEPMVALWL